WSVVMWSIASMSITPIPPMRVVIPTSNPPCHSDRREESASRRHMLTSNPFLSHYHRSDDRHQQQQRRDFEGEHVLSGVAVKKQGRDCLGVLRFAVGHSAFGEERLAFRRGCVNRDEQASERGRGGYSYQPLLVELALFHAAFKVDQHDHEQEQHHDAA